jgi:hypothetical protein
MLAGISTYLPTLREGFQAAEHRSMSRAGTRGILIESEDAFWEYGVTGCRRIELSEESHAKSSFDEGS